jgi:hypothetical protein
MVLEKEGVEVGNFRPWVDKVTLHSFFNENLTYVGPRDEKCN